MKTHKIFIVFIGLMLVGCSASNLVADNNVRVVSSETVQSCKKIGNVSSEAPYYGLFTETTENKLVNLAKESAMRLNANSLVIMQTSHSNNTYKLVGEAYYCVM